MKIVFLKNVMFSGSRYVVGEELDVSEEDAKALCANDLAKHCEAELVQPVVVQSKPKAKQRAKAKAESSGIDAAFADLPEVADGN